MSLTWQEKPIFPRARGGRVHASGSVLERVLYAEPLRRRMQVRVGDRVIVDSEDVVLLHEPGRFPVAYFRLGDTMPDTVRPSGRVTESRDLGTTLWYAVRAGGEWAERGAWCHTDLPDHAEALHDRIAFRWRALDTLYESWRAIDGA
ncbi:DUF427 domain-containing protein [Actinoallomurus acaciae]|uniref:DUF427 domain-containing protein n=1 Tax=Actinoallomurus acaciae TaxID=502577 RepID=A0ABV5YMG1_9ACTN